jgi:DNA-binding transcriptional ArsR family regulator
MTPGAPQGRHQGDDLFAALADPTRRHLVEALASRGGASATTLAAELPISRQAVAKHLAALGGAGLVEGRRQGRERLYELRPQRLDEAAEWIASVGAEWDDRLERLRRLVDR